MRVSKKNFIVNATYGLDMTAKIAGALKMILILFLMVEITIFFIIENGFKGAIFRFIEK